MYVSDVAFIEEKVKMVMKTKTWNAIRMTWNCYLHNKRKAKKA